MYLNPKTSQNNWQSVVIAEPSDFLTDEDDGPEPKQSEEDFIETQFGVIRTNEYKRICSYRISTTEVIIGLKHPCTLYFYGILDVSAIAGSFECNGYVVKENISKTHRIFSLKDSSANYISTVGDSIISGDFLGQLASYNMTEEYIHSLVDHVDYNGVILYITSAIDKYKYMDDIFSRINYNIFPSLDDKNDRVLHDLEVLLHANLDVLGGHRIHKKLWFSQEWDSIRRSFPKDKRYKALFCGGKNVGKSTTLRYMINRTLSERGKVLVLDLDIGQSEFTAGGCISAVLVREPLLGSNFTHLIPTKKTFFIGHVDPMQCCSKYINAVKQLYDFCLFDPRFTQCPWFINTMGITKGFGLILNATVIKIISPDFVLQLQSDQTSLNYDFPLTPENIMPHGIPSEVKYDFFSIRSAVKNSYKDPRSISPVLLSSKNLRDIVILSYLAQIVERTNKNWWDHVHTVLLDDRQIKQTGGKNLFWKFVALSTSEEDEDVHDCIGFGFMRNDEKQACVITPLEKHLLCGVRTFVLCDEVSLKKEIIDLMINSLDPISLVPGTTLQ